VQHFYRTLLVPAALALGAPRADAAPPRRGTDQFFLDGSGLLR
jgi:hypothetical protein